MKRFILYALRWQLSTPVLWLCLVWMTAAWGEMVATIMANLIGACVFYMVDRRIFNKIRS